MPLTDAERQRIYEEEAAKRQVPPRYTPTDWLASCILGPLIIVAVIVALIVGILICAGVYGAMHPSGY